MYLHNDRELFEEIILAAGEKFSLESAIVEKDYYVTMILKELSRACDSDVFKGGTSLSKCFNIINRFSEDIDITFTEHIGESRRKKLKYNIIGSLSEKLDLPIANWNEIESDKDYNCYVFSYKPINNYMKDSLYPGIKLETALASYAFPTEIRSVDSYVRQFLEEDNAELIEEYGLQVFDMKVQSIERTFIDKVFALCDYYVQGKSIRYSRHLYDIYKLNSHIKKNEEFSELVKEVRIHRALLPICPTAKNGINIPKIIHEFCDKHFYEKDYSAITEYFINDFVTYEDTVKCICDLADSEYFK